MKDELIAKMYKVTRDGKEAIELRMDGFGIYVDMSALGKMTFPFIEKGLEKLRAFEPEHGLFVADGAGGIVMSASRSEPEADDGDGLVSERKKRKYTKRNMKYWNKK